VDEPQNAGDTLVPRPRVAATPGPANHGPSVPHDSRPAGETIAADRVDLDEALGGRPSEAPRTEAPTGASVTVVHGDKIDAVHYYGRILDYPNTRAVRGGTVDEIR